MTTDEKIKPVIDLYDQAVKNYEQALKTAVKMQEESAKCFTAMVAQAPSLQDWQGRAKVIADEWIPQTQKTVDEGLKILEKASRSSVDLLKKAVAAGQATTPQEAQAKFLGLWESSLNAMRDTTVAVTEANAKAFEAWMTCAGKKGETAAAGTKA
jgi:dihydroxyacetone kinase